VRLSEVLAMLKSKQYSGAILMHFKSGIPALVEIPRIKLTIREPIPVDKPPEIGSQ
jgi:hypothetical protein